MAHVLGKKWRSEDVKARENVDFSALLLSDRLLKGLNNAGFKKPSPIQLDAIPHGRFGYDIMVQAKSGTGKTLVFAIVALEMLKPKLFRPQILVVAPTREIATQICSVFRKIGSTFPKLTCVSFIGGLPLFEDKEKAVMSQIVVGTPGRLRQLIDLKALPTNSIRLLVFDEADELCGQSFKDDIETIFQSLPEGKQVIATSATFSPGVKKILKRYLKDDHSIRLNVTQLALLGMVHYAEVIQFCPMPALQHKYKLEALRKIIMSVKFAQCLLFCSGVQRVEVIHKDIEDWGFSSTYISSAKEQSDRMMAMSLLKRFKCKVLVTSDLTARGIDAENVDLVVNFDLAYKTEVYMHRAGRAGRYGTVGLVISLVQSNELDHLKRIEKEGSFKTLKLPDPIPRDIILNPPEEEFVIDEPNSDYDDLPKVPKRPKFIFTDDEFLTNCDQSEEEVSVENGEIKDVSETSVDRDGNDCENGLPKSVTSNGVESHNDTTELNVKSDAKIEKVDEDNSVHTESESVHSDNELNDKRLQNGSTENSTKLDSDLENDYDQNKLIQNESIDKFLANDIHGNYDDKETFKKEDIMNDSIENDNQLNNQFPNVSENLKTNDFETVKEKLNEVQTDNLHESLEIGDDIENTENGKKLNEMQIGNVLESSKIKNVLENPEDDSMNCEPENVNESGNRLINVIKTFIDTYESDKKVESPTSKIVLDSQSSENSDKKNITIDMIKALNSQKKDFFYKTFKKFCEDKEAVLNPSKNEKEDKEAVPNLFKNEKEDKGEDIQKDFDLLTEIENKSNADSVKHEKLAESLEYENSEVILEKPHFESTPQLSAKDKQENAKAITNEVVFKPIFPDKFMNVSPVLSDSDSSVNNGTNEILNKKSSLDFASETLFSESESDSSSGDSSEESDSETDSSVCSKSESSSSTSSSHEVNKGGYHHHHHNPRTGRQNPSLISNSPRNGMYHDQFTHRNFPNHNYCHRTMQHTPFQNEVRNEMPRNRGCRHRVVDQNPSVPFNHTDTRNFRGASGDIFAPSNSRGNLPYSERAFQSADREQNFSGCSATNFSFSRNHSKCCRSKNSSRNITREESRNANKNKHCRRCPKHQHSPRCFLPTVHRCHPNTPEYPCTQGPICDMWYKTFYNQWLYIQNLHHQ